jgi:4-aminobutyrate aminotransferase
VQSPSYLAMQTPMTCGAGMQGGTYGGNAVACAAGCATLQAIEEEGMLQNAVDRGEQLKAGLLQLQSK